MASASGGGRGKGGCDGVWFGVWSMVVRRLPLSGEVELFATCKYAKSEYF